MNIRQLNDSDKDIYNTFVFNNNGSFLQSWEWGEWQESLGRKAYRYTVTNTAQSVSLRGVSSASERRRGNPSTEDAEIASDALAMTDILLAAEFIEHTTPFGNYLYCPYGPVADLRLKIEDLSNTTAELLNQVRKDFPDLLFIRLEPTYNLNLKSYNLLPTSHVQPDQTLIVDITKSTDELLTSFHPKTRYNIKVAEKHGVKVETFTQVNMDVIDLIMETSNRQKYRNHPREYIEKLWDFFTKNSGDVKVTGYLASTNGKPAASGLMVDFVKTRMYLFGGSNYELRASMAPYLLHWQAMQDAKQKNLSTYDLGASETASGNSGGFMRFKLGFSPTLIKFGGASDVVNKNLRYTIYKLSRKLNHFFKHL